MTSSRHPATAFLAAVALAGLPGCGESPASSNPPVSMPSVPPPPPEVPGITRGASQGTTDMRLVGADPEPGATITGCGAGAEGCGGRLSMTVRLYSPVGGPFLGVLAHLHSDRALACFVALAPGGVLPPRTESEVLLAFEPEDTNEACPTPLDLTHLAVVVEGPVEVSARQEWAIRYRLER